MLRVSGSFSLTISLSLVAIIATCGLDIVFLLLERAFVIVLI